MKLEFRQAYGAPHCDATRYSGIIVAPAGRENCRTVWLNQFSLAIMATLLLHHQRLSDGTIQMTCLLRHSVDVCATINWILATHTN